MQTYSSSRGLTVPSCFNRAPQLPPHDNEMPGPASLSKEEATDSTKMLPPQPCVVFSYDFDAKQWRKRSSSVEIAKGYFARGVCRIVHKGNEITPSGKNPVVIKFLDATALVPLVGPITREMYFNDAHCQAVAVAMSKKYNDRNPPKLVTYLPLYVVELPKLNALCLMEPVLPDGTFLKHNNNNGGILTEHQTPQAFSHFTLEHSKKEMLVVDVQGVGEVYTDPQIHHVRDRNAFGLGNQGQEGVNKFLRSHSCNGVCLVIGLPRVINGKNAAWPEDLRRQVMSSMSQKEQQEKNQEESGNAAAESSSAEREKKADSAVADPSRKVAAASASQPVRSLSAMPPPSGKVELTSAPKPATSTTGNPRPSTTSTASTGGVTQSSSSPFAPVHTSTSSQPPSATSNMKPARPSSIGGGTTTGGGGMSLSAPAQTSSSSSKLPAQRSNSPSFSSSPSASSSQRGSQRGSMQQLTSPKSSTLTSSSTTSSQNQASRVVAPAAGVTSPKAIGNVSNPGVKSTAGAAAASSSQQQQQQQNKTLAQLVQQQKPQQQVPATNGGSGFRSAPAATSAISAQQPQQMSSSNTGSGFRNAPSTPSSASTQQQQQVASPSVASKPTAQPQLQPSPRTNNVAGTSRSVSSMSTSSPLANPASAASQPSPRPNPLVAAGINSNVSTRPVGNPASAQQQQQSVSSRPATTSAGNSTPRGSNILNSPNKASGAIASAPLAGARNSIGGSSVAPGPRPLSVASNNNNTIANNSGSGFRATQTSSSSMGASSSPAPASSRPLSSAGAVSSPSGKSVGGMLLQQSQQQQQQQIGVVASPRRIEPVDAPHRATASPSHAGGPRILSSTAPLPSLNSPSASAGSVTAAGGASSSFMRSSPSARPLSRPAAVGELKASLITAATNRAAAVSSAAAAAAAATNSTVSSAASSHHHLVSNNNSSSSSNAFHTEKIAANSVSENRTQQSLAAKFMPSALSAGGVDRTQLGVPNGAAVPNGSLRDMYMAVNEMYSNIKQRGALNGAEDPAPSPISALTLPDERQLLYSSTSFSRGDTILAPPYVRSASSNSLRTEDYASSAYLNPSDASSTSTAWAGEAANNARRSAREGVSVNSLYRSHDSGFSAFAPSRRTDSPLFSRYTEYSSTIGREFAAEAHGQHHHQSLAPTNNSNNSNSNNSNSNMNANAVGSSIARQSPMGYEGSKTLSNRGDMYAPQTTSSSRQIAMDSHGSSIIGASPRYSDSVADGTFQVLINGKLRDLRAMEC